MHKCHRQLRELPMVLAWDYCHMWKPPLRCLPRRLARHASKAWLGVSSGCLQANVKIQMSDKFFRWGILFDRDNGYNSIIIIPPLNSKIASLATPPSSDCTKTVFRGYQYQASRIWLTCVWYCNIGNMLIVCNKSDTSPTCPNFSSTCPNKFFMSEPSGVIGGWLIHPESRLSVGTIGFSETSVSATIHQSNTCSAWIAHAISPSNQHETTLIQTWTTILCKILNPSGIALISLLLCWGSLWHHHIWHSYIAYTF